MIATEAEELRPRETLRIGRFQLVLSAVTAAMGICIKSGGGVSCKVFKVLDSSAFNQHQLLQQHFRFSYSSWYTQ